MREGERERRERARKRESERERRERERKEREKREGDTQCRGSRVGTNLQRPGRCENPTAQSSAQFETPGVWPLIFSQHPTRPFPSVTTARSQSFRQVYLQFSFRLRLSDPHFISFLSFLSSLSQMGISSRWNMLSKL